MKSPSQNLISLLDEVITKIGISPVARKLKEMLTLSAGTGQDQLKKKICSEVSESFGFPIKTIMESSRRGTVTQAKVMLMILFYQHTEMSQQQIAGHFSGRSQTLVNRRIKAFYSMGKSEKEREFQKIYSDEFIKKYENINSRINEWKKK